MKWGVRRFQNSKGGRILKKTAYGIANVATLGSVGHIRRRENMLKNRPRARSYSGATITGILNGFGYHYTKVGIGVGTALLASAAGAAYLKSGGDPKVKQGAMIAGRIVNAVGKATVATTAGYALYDTARAYKDAYDYQNNPSKFKKKKTTKKR